MAFFIKIFLFLRFHEKKLSLSEIVPYLHRVLNHSSSNNVVETTNNSNHTYSRSESRSASVSVNENRSMNISYIFDEKLVANTRKRFDNQVPMQLLYCAAESNVVTQEGWLGGDIYDIFSIFCFRFLMFWRIRCKKFHQK